jgi:hydroxymethylpyrimidine pyrophosphatase-like HAD family hydrolase
VTVRVLYTDLDGTMVGPFGSFFHDAQRSLTRVPADALLALHRAEVTLVLVSGRGRASLGEAAAIFGADGYIGEMGAVLAWDRGRQVEVLTGAMPPGLAGTPVEVMERAGLPAALFAAFPGRLEYHAPWHLDHAADVMLRGNVDPAETERRLAEWGWPWVRLRDNGVLPRRRLPGHPDLPVHVYHLMPDGLGKGLGVAADLARRGIPAADAAAVGDSVSDLEMAAVVGQFWLTANGAAAPATRLLAETLGVRVTSGPMGLGWAEAVLAAIGD